MVVAAARVAAGEVMVGALVPILVPVVGLVQVAAVLLLLLLEVGAALLLVVGAALLLVVGAALLLVVGAALLLVVGAALLLVVGAALLLVVGAALLLVVGAALLLVVGAALLLVVGAALLLVVGAALLLLLVAVGAADHHYTPLVPEIWVHTRSREKDMVAVIFSAQPNSYTVAGGCRCTSDKEAFLYIRLRMTPQYSIDRSQRRKDYMYCTQQLGHHACCTCEVNGFVQIPYMRAVHMLHAHLPIAV